jgi:hypothetical protein
MLSGLKLKNDDIMGLRGNDARVRNNGARVMGVCGVDAKMREEQDLAICKYGPFIGAVRVIYWNSVKKKNLLNEKKAGHLNPAFFQGSRKATFGSA